MKTLNHSSGVRYAVIQVRQSDLGAEHFVIQYHDVRALRQFLAKPSIVATGFSSRDEATKESLIVGTRNRTLLNFICGFGVLPGCDQFRMLKMPTLSPLQGLGRALKALNKIIQIAGAALHTSQSRLTCEQQRLEPAVQQQ